MSPAPRRSLLISVMRISGQEFNFLDGSIADVINILNKIAFVFQADKTGPPRERLSVLSSPSRKIIYSWTQVTSISTQFTTLF